MFWHANNFDFGFHENTNYVMKHVKCYIYFMEILNMFIYMHVFNVVIANLCYNSGIAM